ncbi:MAG: hypothetical protein ACKVX9_19935 [Blastocatellia bacterium]
MDFRKDPIRNMRQGMLSVLVLPVFWIAFAVAGLGQSAAPQAKPIESLSAAEFSRLSREFSEDGGFFRSDNFVSNETSYLHIVDKLRNLGASGGAYLGVGPEQNFTYIAKIRPRIAFIVDIRRQAVIQHLMYKAIFQLSPTRAQFLSRLLSKPQPPHAKDKSEPGLNDLLAHFEKAPRDEKAYALNLAEIRKVIRDDCQFPLTEGDLASLEYVYRNFRDDGMEIAYRMESSAWSGYFPSLKEILLGTDLNGKVGNFLAIPEDYEFVREMHRKNLIIPVVGDFGGKKALASVGDYLRKNGLTVTAFYTSNVEQYLFGSEVFANFVANVRKLPLSEKSLFIRAVAGRMPHPARVAGHRLTTLLQLIPVFIKDFDEGLYPTYTDLVTTHFIGPEKP